MNNLDECFHDIMYGWIQVFIPAIHYEYHPYALHFLSKYGGRIYEYCEKKQSALFPAIEDNNLLMLRYLHTHSTQINYRDKDGLTPLMYACLHNRLEIVKYLIDNNADVNARTANETEYTIGKNNVHIYSGSTALIITSQKGHLDIAASLIEHNSDINASSGKDGATALVWARNADVNARGWGGNAPLIEAAENNSIDMANILIEYNADINIQNDSGYTPLIIAAKYNNVDIVNLLIQHHADENIQNNDGKTFFDYSRK